MKVPDINRLLRARPRYSSYGAPMGARNIFDSDDASKLYCQRVRFVDGDYGADGTYWGGGSPLYCVFNAELTTRCYYRAPSHMAALRLFNDEHGDDRRAALQEVKT